MKRKLLFTAMLAIAGALSMNVQAQRTDVTSTYLTDAALENEGANWALVSNGGNHAWNGTNKYHESWHNTFTITQTTSPLPAGYYQLSIQAAVEGGTSTTISLQATSGSNTSVAAYPKYSTHSSYADMAAWWAADATGTGNRNLNRIFTTVYVEEGQTLTATFKQTANNQWFVYGQMQLHKLTDEEGRNAQILEAAYNPMTNLDMAGARYKQRFEDYTGGTVTGKKLVKTISGLPKGKYNVTLNGGASYTSGRGFDGNTGDNLTTFYANNASTNVTVVDRGDILNGDFIDYTASGALVTDGSLEVGYNNSAIGANWFVGSVKYIELVEPYISYIATEIHAATATALDANTWYKFTPASDDDYSFTTTTIEDVVYTTTDQLPSTATTAAVSDVMALTTGTTYYIKSASAQTLTIAPQTFTYTIGSPAADKSYIQEGNTVTVTYASLSTDDPNPTLVKNFSGVTFGGNSISCTPTANGFTFTVPAVTAGTNYNLNIPANAIGYSNGTGTYNEAQTITLHAPAVFDGTYYLYNPTTSRFLARGNSSGTAAVADFYGIPFTLTVDGEGYATIVFLDNNQGLFNGGGDDVWCWTDNTAGKYQLTAVEGGCNIKGQGTADDEYLHVSTSDDYRVGFKGTATVWQFKTPAERNTIVNAYPTDNKTNVITSASLTSETNAAGFETWLETNRAAKDYTSFVGTARITNTVGSWTWAGVRGQGGQPAYNNAAEAWNATGSWSQTISGLPEGIYRITINAFERRANNATSYALGQAGYGTVTSSYLKANDEQVRIKSWYEEVVYDGANYDPNNMTQAVTAFNNDKYKSELYTYVGNDGNLTLTIAKPNYIWDCWLLWNNITLTYYTDQVEAADVTALLATAAEYLEKPMLATLKTAIREAKTALEGEGTIANYNALHTAIENSQTSVDSYAAMKDNYLDPLADVLANTNVYTTSAYNSVYANYLTAYNNGTISNADANALRWNAAVSGNGTRPVDDLLMPTWTVGGNAHGATFYQNTWSTEGANDGTNFLLPFFEYWVGDNDVLAATTLQTTQTGLTPNTGYEVSAWVRVQESNAGAKIADGITMQVGNGPAVDVTVGDKIGDSKRYIAEYKAYGMTDADGVLTIKFIVAESSNISWLAFKNLNYAEAEDVTIDENDDYTPQSTFANVTLKRTIKANTWNTLVLPFNLDEAALKAAFGSDVAIATYSETPNGTNSTITFTTMGTPAITANVPVLLKTSTASAAHTFNGVFIEAGEAKAEGSENGNFDFVGTYAASITVAAGDYYIKSDKLYKSQGNTTMKGTRAYLKDKSMGAGEVKLFFDDLATGIEEVEGLMPETLEDEAYDLSGRRVNKPVRGLYIVNGKKVFVK